MENNPNHFYRIEKTIEQTTPTHAEKSVVILQSPTLSGINVLLTKLKKVKP